MPEAVIVSTARTPDRPGHEGVAHRAAAPTTSPRFIVDAALNKVPELDRSTGRGPHPRLRPARRRVRLQHRPRRRHPGRHARRPRRHRQPLLLVVAAVDPHGRPRHQGRRGRRLRRRRRRDREPLPARHGRRRPAQPERTATPRPAPPSAPRAARAPGRRSTAACPTSTSPWARPPRTWRPVRGRHPRGAGRVRRPLAAAGHRPLERGFWEDEITPVETIDATATPSPSPRTTASAPAPPSRGWPSSSRSSAPTAPSPPATPAR